MKLIFAIVSNEDEHRLVDYLHENEFQVTKLCSTGSFLKMGNTTLLVGVEDEQVDKVIELIEKYSKSRKRVVNTAMMPGTIGAMFTSSSTEVTVGGATVFVIDVDRFERI